MIRKGMGGVLCLSLVLASAMFAQAQETLGRLDFPTSGSREAQVHFIRGVAALHNFWYEEAAKSFQEAQKVDPNFAMAYWGEAMSHNHPLWSQQDIAAARSVLARLGPSRKARMDKAPTAREKTYLEAAEILYGDGDKLARDMAFSQAMEKLYVQYPEDREAASLYALSLLGTVRPGDKGFRRQMKSAAILEKLFRENPNHPGAAHYLIHSYDDPEHAPLGLPAARAYGVIAAAAHHARHMPSHIYVQLGLWDDVARSNTSAYQASVDWVAREKLSVTKRDFHSLAWLQYAQLQMGKKPEAKQLIADLEKIAADTREQSLGRTALGMRIRYAIETGEFDVLPAAGPADNDRYSNNSSYQLAAGIRSAKAKDMAAAETAANALKALRETNEKNGRGYEAKNVEIMEKEVRALMSLASGRTDDALETLKLAAALEESLDAPSGPPDPMKPSHELFGEVLLDLKRPREAAEQFQKALLRMPSRALSAKGLERANAATNTSSNPAPQR